MVLEAQKGECMLGGVMGKIMLMQISAEVERNNLADALCAPAITFRW
jgi:hypothetical protein